MSVDEDGLPTSCPKCGYSPVMAARVVRDKVSKSTGETTARAGDVAVLCLHCDNFVTQIELDENEPPDDFWV